MRLRTFGYLDDRLTKQYLAQLEGGAYDVEDHSDTGSRERGVRGDVHVGPAGVGAGLGSKAQATVARTVRQTPESDFVRLEGLLDRMTDPEGVTDLELVDDAVWRGLAAGEVLRVRARVKVPSLYAAASLAQGMGPLMELMETFGEVLPDEDREAMAGVSAIGQTERLSVVAHLAGSPRFKFACRLRRADLRGEVEELAGEWTVLGTLDRHLRSQERYSVLDDLGLGGMSAMPRDDRRKVLRDMQKDMPDAVVTAPAAVMTPVAIYR